MTQFIRYIGFFLLFSIFTLLLSCAGPGQWAAQIQWEELTFDELPGQEEYPNSGAIILKDQGNMEIFGGGRLGFSVFEQHRIIKILNAQGQSYANIAIPYTENGQVEHIQARTISPDGKITVLDKDNIFDINLYPNFVFYSDQRAKIFTMPAVEDGAVIEYKYRLNIESKTFWHSWQFQNDVPTLISRFTLDSPSEWEVNYRVYGLDIEPELVEAPEGFKATYVWESTDIPALDAEFAMPPSKELRARLALAPLGVESWQDVAQWYHQLIEPQMKATDRIQKLAVKLTKGLKNEEEKLEAIYEWVRDNVRYMALEIGIGGFQPYPAREVLLNQYGDCKDMTTLLCTLCKEAGIDVHEVLVSSWQNGIPDTTLPSPLHFNHVIAYCPAVGEEGIWMDPTQKGTPFGQLPWYDQGIPVLVVGEGGEGRLVTTPQTSPETNQSVMDWQVKLKSDGSAEIEGETRLYGAFAEEKRRDLIYTSRADLRQWLETYLAQRCSGAILDSFSLAGVQPAQDPLTISYQFSTTTFAIPREQNLIFQPSTIYSLNHPDFFRSTEREHPIRFQYGFQNELYLKINLPHGFTLKSQENLDDVVQSAFGSAHWQQKINDNTLHMHTRYLLKGDEVAPSQYQAFQKFLDKIRRNDLREMVLTNGELVEAN